MSKLLKILIIPLLFPLSLPAQTDKATKCHVTDVDIWAGKSANEAASKTNSPTTYVEIPKGALVYFYAESQVENDPEQRQLIYTYTYADGKTDTHPTDYNDTNDTANHPYSNTGDYTVSIKCERENFAGSYATNQCKVRITAENLKVEIVKPEEFITTDTKLATLQSASEGTSVTWSTETLEHPDTGGGTATATAQEDQREALITFDNSDHPEDGRGYALSYRIKAAVTGSGYTYTADMTQDNLSGLMQEYIDLSVPTTHPPGAFDQTQPPAIYTRLLDDPSKGGTTDDICNWHEWWIVFSLIGHAQDLDNTYDGNLNVTSGYRCPVGNKAANGAPDSIHMRGRALDYNQQNSYQNWLVWYAATEVLDTKAYVHTSTGVDYWVNAPWPLPDGVYYTRGHVQW